MKNQIITLNSEGNLDLWAELKGIQRGGFESTKLFSGDLVNISVNYLTLIPGTRCIIEVTIRGRES
jgi:hypothetical protein